jgi:hypothetical protein
MMQFLSFFIAFLMFCGYGFTATKSPELATPVQVSSTPTPTFENFTGKILKNRVRMRCRPDLEGHIVKELNKNDYLLVTGQEGDFWIVTPPNDMKFFAFRSYIIDNMIEANRVNIRLSPDTESPIVGQLMHGDHVEGEVSSLDHRWLEIKPPSNVHFFVAKEFVEKAGDLEYFSKIQTRKEEVESLFSSANALSETESKKVFSEMNLDEACAKFDAIIRDYSDFPEYVRKAKENLAFLQDNYLQKKLSFLETKVDLVQNVSDHETVSIAPEKIEKKENSLKKPPKEPKNCSLTKKMSSWISVEEGLFTAWQQVNSGKDLEQFYHEQEINGQTLSGIVTSYDITLKDSPGDFLLKSESSPIAFLYSTRIDLSSFVGKKVTLKVSQRANNNFAFPAYFVTSVAK